MKNQIIALIVASIIVVLLIIIILPKQAVLPAIIASPVPPIP